jgi:hypothetical protein
MLQPAARAPDNAREGLRAADGNPARLRRGTRAGNLKAGSIANASRRVIAEFANRCHPSNRSDRNVK